MDFWRNGWEGKNSSFSETDTTVHIDVHVQVVHNMYILMLNWPEEEIIAVYFNIYWYKKNIYSWTESLKSKNICKKIMEIYILKFNDLRMLEIHMSPDNMYIY